MNDRPDTRTRILDAAQELIQRRGVNGMSFKDISDIVGIRKPSIHHHFASKDDLVVALLQRYRQQFEDTLVGLTDQHKTVREQLIAYMRLFEQTLQVGDQDQSCLCGMLAAEVLSLCPHACDAVNGFLSDNVRFLSELLQDGREQGALQFVGEPADVAAMMFAALQGGLIVARSQAQPQQMAIVTRQLLRSVSPPVA